MLNHEPSYAHGAATVVVHAMSEGMTGPRAPGCGGGATIVLLVCSPCVVYGDAPTAECAATPAAAESDVDPVHAGIIRAG